MQEIVAFCDHHAERDGSRVLGEGFRIGISGTWKRIDLCRDCMRELMGPLEVVLSAHGRAVAEVNPALVQAKTAAKRSGYSDAAYARRLEAMKSPRQCLWCPEVVEGGYSNHKAHLWLNHGLETLEQAYGRTCPICRQSDISRLSSHVGRGHMIKLADAFEWAYWGPDPFAKALAQERRELGTNVGKPASTVDTIELVEAARQTWEKAHGQPQ